MSDTTTQRSAFDFLLDHIHTQEPFTKDAFHGAVRGWSKSSLDTYWSKQIKRLLSPAGRNQFRVAEAFRPYANWDSSGKHIATQVRRIYSDYTSLIYDDLVGSPPPAEFGEPAEAEVWAFLCTSKQRSGAVDQHRPEINISPRLLIPNNT